MNKRRLWSSLSAVLGFVLVSSAAQSPESPKTMMKISTRVLEPKPESGSFAAQSRTLWRAGTKYARVAEPPDAQNHVEALIIINEPEAWMINLVDMSGKHIVDPGPSLDVHLPIFQDISVSTKVKDLEFGRELEFFSKNGAQGSEGEPINGMATERYDITIENSKIVLRTDVKSKKPLRVSLVEGGQTKTIEYLSYDDDLAFNPLLFQPPAGILIQNLK